MMGWLKDILEENQYTYGIWPPWKRREAMIELHSIEQENARLLAELEKLKADYSATTERHLRELGGWAAAHGALAKELADVQLKMEEMRHELAQI